MGTGRFLRRTAPAALLVGVAVLSVLPPPAVAQADKTIPGGKPSIEILAPVAGAVIPPGKVVVIGRVRGAAIPSVEIDVNGKVHHKAVSSAGGFMASVYLIRGKNVLLVHADGATVERTILGADAVNYKYHPEVENCGGCHADVAKGYVVSGRKDTVCYQCHDRKDGKKLVHGPLGGGEPLVRCWRDPRHSAHWRVVLTPHAAFYSEESRRELRMKAALTCRRALAGELILSVVN